MINKSLAVYREAFFVGLIKRGRVLVPRKMIYRLRLNRW